MEKAQDATAHWPTRYPRRSKKPEPFRAGSSHRDNRAIVQYELARRRIEVGEALMNGAPRPLVVRGGESGGEQSALSTLVIARMLPQLTAEGSGGFSEIKGDSADGSLRGKAEESARGAAANFLGSGDNE